MMDDATAMEGEQSTAPAQLVDPIETWSRALRDPSPSVRCRAAQELGAMGGPIARQALREALADPHPAVRQAIQRALVQSSRG